MSSTRQPRVRQLFASLLVAPLLLAGCGGSSDGPAGGQGGGTPQSASAVATPSSASIARGATARTTVVFSHVGGLTLGNTFSINFPVTGFAANIVSTTTTASTITQVYDVTVDGTVPLGTQLVRFSASVSGWAAGSGTTYAATTATYTVTVTP